ncbi:MAG TPA: hypothetical protein ENJ09_10325 [Planctomycetes bacterium]|nr:hypothetical protein [Planctomycetota bacterium]
MTDPHARRRPRGRGGRSVSREPGPGLFRDIVLAPDRERIPEARPVISLGGGEDREFEREVRKRIREELRLRRRGLELGRVAELEPEGLLPKRPRRSRREVIELERWVSARPIFVPEGASRVRGALVSEDLPALHAALLEPSGLRALLEQRASRLGPAWSIEPSDEAVLFDPERDLARIRVAREEADGERVEVWVKTGRLSLAKDDRSLRVRVFFGIEGDDDASADPLRHAAVREFAERILPGARSLAGATELWQRIERLAGRPVQPAAHIAYWNAPNGGARFHHDAFPEESGPTRQLGVLYAQLTGRTLWLALSIEELAARVREFVGWIREGEMPWLREQLGEAWGAIHRATERRAPTLAALAEPNCGLFAPFLDGPEFTAFLVDAGHALLLRPGDALLLPNHGLDRTAMHSVFCASKEPGYALSVAIRG